MNETGTTDKIKCPGCLASNHELLWTFIRSSFRVTFIFTLVYVGCDYITGIRTTRWQVDFAFERSLPFVPELTLVYSSVFLMVAIAPFLLGTRNQILLLERRAIAVTLVAGIAFLLFPAELRFPPYDLSRQTVFFRIADKMSLTYNLCPSLHVAFAALCAESYRRARPRTWPFHLWSISVAIAAWATHQHHLIDLFAGYGLGLAMTRLPRNCKLCNKRCNSNPLANTIVAR